MERSLVAKTELARVEAETRCYIAERELDRYKRMIQRMQDRLNMLMRDSHAHAPRSQQTEITLLLRLLHGFPIPMDSGNMDAVDDTENDDIMQEEEVEELEEYDDSHNDDDDVDMLEDVSVVEDDEATDEDPFHEPVSVHGGHFRNSYDMHRRQPRTISITENDL